MRFSLCESVSVTNEISVKDKQDFKKRVEEKRWNRYITTGKASETVYSV